LETFSPLVNHLSKLNTVLKNAVVLGVVLKTNVPILLPLFDLLDLRPTLLLHLRFAAIALVSVIGHLDLLIEST
jgi:hypothetical protein